MANDPTHKQPHLTLMRRKVLITTAVGCLLIAAALLGWQFLKEFLKDPLVGTATTTAGDIAATEYVEGGSRAVVFQPNGTKKLAPGWSAPAQDIDIAWHPSGNYLFFASNRKTGEGFNIYRWILKTDKVDARTSGSRSKTLPLFPNDSGPRADFALVSEGGFIKELDTRRGTTTQVLPPTLTQLQGTAEGGAAGQMEGLYKDIGSSFRKAVVTPDRSWVFAVMRYELGEVLVAQNLAATSARDALPAPIMAGRSVQLVAANDGTVAFLVQSFKIPPTIPVPKEWIKDGKLVPPFKHIVSTIRVVDGKLDQKVVLQSDDDAQAVDGLAISPDGQKLLVVAGAFDGVNFKPQTLVEMPSAEGGVRNAKPILRGEIRTPSYGPDGDRIAFVRSEKGHDSIYTVRSNGSELEKVSDEGDYGQPKISPQKLN